jgi:hypothetical protein
VSALLKLVTAEVQRHLDRCRSGEGCADPECGDAFAALLEYVKALGDDPPAKPSPRAARDTYVQTEPGLTAVDLWYPGLKDEPATIVELQLVHVRAARDIRVQYDLARDGYSISAQDTTGKASADGEYTGDEPYAEVAFVPAWAPDDGPL